VHRHYLFAIAGSCVFGVGLATVRADTAETRGKATVNDANVQNPMGQTTPALIAPVGPPETPTPRVEVPEWWRLRFESMNARLKQGNVDLIFVGDSITQRWEQDGKDVWNQYYGRRNAVNLGIDGDRTQQVLWRLDHGNLDGISPRLAVLLIGTNNIPAAPAEDIAKAIQAIVERLRTRVPKMRVLLLGILPRAATQGDTEDDVRQTIAKVNDRVAAMADNKTVFFLDIGRRFRQADGTLLKEAYTSDMVHLASHGYEIWADAIEPTVTMLMNHDD
jgi:beta-glucosidase